MRIAALEPFLCELVLSFDRGADLVAVSEGAVCDASVPRVTRGASGSAAARGALLPAPLASRPIDIALLKAAAPDLVLTSLPDLNGPDAPAGQAAVMERELSSVLGKDIRLISYNPLRLEDIYGVWEKAGVDLGAGARGRTLAGRTRAQFMDWADNFYERSKSKRVSVIGGVDPFSVMGRWVPDMVQLLSAVSQTQPGSADRVVEWSDITAFRPDVLIVAPSGMPLVQSSKLFAVLEKLPGWEDLPAVKRGECFFADGCAHFHDPGPSLMESMGVLASAVGGMDSGYITKRDSFFRLRYLELHRHKYV